MIEQREGFDLGRVKGIHHAKWLWCPECSRWVGPKPHAPPIRDFGPRQWKAIHHKSTGHEAVAIGYVKADGGSE